MSTDRQKLGKWGEEQGSRYLESLGYHILCRNYRCRIGEVDIIAAKEGQLVFIEVKTRRTASYGSPSEAVNYRKRAKYEKAALYFIKETGQKDVSCRFDIIEVMVHPDGTCTINHIVNAYAAGFGSYYY
ncbi:MAG TPA: YraN family protein [Clostridiales bacterium]|nr:YraN family protein [Clostridiales bacterium]